MRHTGALLNPKASILIQKRHPYSGYVNSEASGDRRNDFLRYVNVLGVVGPVGKALVSAK